ncbi:MAG: hypothetical protein ACRDFB_07215 [Rhabdochlamydiaceae bacterium]
MARGYIRKIIVISSLAFLAACGNSKVMTREDYYTISAGDHAEEVINKYGEPYSITNRKDGTQVYLYIEKIPAGDMTAEQNNYILIVRNGRVVSKRSNQELPPAYDEVYDDDPNDVPN